MLKDKFASSDLTESIKLEVRSSQPPSNKPTFEQPTFVHLRMFIAVYLGGFGGGMGESEADPIVEVQSAGARASMASGGEGEDEHSPRHPVGAAGQHGQ